MYILNKDIGVMEENQEVIVKVDTYPFQEFGTLKGEIKHISPNSFMMEGVGYVYKINVHVANEEIIKDNIKYDIS